MNDIRESRLYIAPSLLAADFASLADEVRRIEQAGADVLHLDVMDGHFVPNISFGPPVIEKLRGHSDLFFDTHLMIMEPLRYAKAFVAAGANSITFHIEVVDNPIALIDTLHELGVKAGVCLNPNTPPERLDACLPHVDLVNVMTVEPGFGGQTFMHDMLAKVCYFAERLEPWQRLEVDGGVNLQTIDAATGAGADLIVAGTAVFRATDPRSALEELRSRGTAAMPRTQR